jgi:transposase
MGHVLMETRNGLAVDATLTHATGTAERDATLTMLDRRSRKGRITLGADKAYDVTDFVGDLRTLRLRQIERDIAKVDAAIETIIRANETLSRKADILTSIPLSGMQACPAGQRGIAKVTAFAMLIHMPELGELTGKQAASLGGLAPISRQSASQ